MVVDFYYLKGKNTKEKIVIFHSITISEIINWHDFLTEMDYLAHCYSNKMNVDVHWSIM